jgi:hypothetical protein
MNLSSVFDSVSTFAELLIDFALFAPEPESMQVLPVVETGFSSDQLPVQKQSGLSFSAFSGVAPVLSSAAPMALNPVVQAPLARSLDDSPSISGRDQQADGDAWML